MMWVRLVAMAGEYWELTWEQLKELFPDIMEVPALYPRRLHARTHTRKHAHTHAHTHTHTHHARALSQERAPLDSALLACWQKLC